jgi:hypothetical protein
MAVAIQIPGRDAFGVIDVGELLTSERVDGIIFAVTGMSD